MTENPKDTSLSQYDANNDVLADDGKYRGDGAYQLKEIVITSPSGGEVDVAEIFTQCSIYEDLMANTMSASLSFIDTNNIVKHLPILGQSEKLKIIFQSPSMDKVTYEFLIYKVGVRALSTVGKNKVLLSEQFLLNSLKIPIKELVSHTTIK